MMWIIKYLTDYPEVQAKLRGILYDSIAHAKQCNRIPTFSEIRSARIPYLDAVVEEVNRLNAFTVTRSALVDTQILGCPIPKGTEVFMVSNGPGFMSPHLPVDDTKRTEASRAAKIRDYWDESEDLTVFRPERWLSTDADGTTEFDGAAGPQLVFGLGPRACWGRRLATLELRTIIAMLIWTFEFLETPKSLSSYRAYEGIARAPHMCYVRLKRAQN
jgi:cytochrome P450